MNDKTYCYFFTRQDLSPEQQIVQTAHVALKLGDAYHKPSKSFYNDPVPCEPLDPNNTYFTVVGVRNEDALDAVRRILEEFEYEFVEFFEPDVNGVTSIATYPIREHLRGPLMAFNLLRISRN